MGLLTSILRPGSIDPGGLPGPIDDFWYGPAGRASVSGVRVTPETALQSSAVYAAVRVIAETLAALPLNMRETIPGGSQPAPDHPIQHTIHSMPNPWQTSFEWREMMMGHVLLRGNGYSEILPNRGGPILSPLNPDRVQVKRMPDGRIVYLLREMSGTERVLFADEVFHLRGLSVDGLVGLNFVALMRDAIGLTLATEQYGGRFFSQDGTPTGLLTTPGTLSPEAAKRIEDSWQRSHAGLHNAHKIAVLEQDLKWQSMGMTAEDAQFLETRKFQVTEIARAFRIPPHMIGDLERATFSNVEQQDLNFVRHTMTPWVVRFEQVISRDLVEDPERFFPKFNLNALLRGDVKTRGAFYATGIRTGWLTRNEARAFEDLNPLPGLDEPLSPLNMATGNPPAAGSDQGGAPPPRQRAVAWAIARESAARLVNKEVVAVNKASEKMGESADQFHIAINKFYKDHSAMLQSQLRISPDQADDYCNAQAELVTWASATVTNDWMATKPDELVALALGGAQP